MANTQLFTNMVLALGAAFLASVVAAKLGQSVILGYVVAGMLIGPFTPGLVGETAIVSSLADIGIIFLMFTIGIQLSLRDLARVGKVALLGGSAQVLLCLGLGYWVGSLLRWPAAQSLFFGAVLSNSSSTVLTKTLGDRCELDSVHAHVSLAWSSVQDFGTVVLVVVLSSIAQGTGNWWSGMTGAVVKAAVFLVLLVALGSVAAPRLFEWVARLRNREIFVMAIAAVALGTAYVASFFGLSLALGAFVAGIMISESDLSHHILGQITPFRDVFAGLFFVSVGMLVNPAFVVSKLSLVALTLVLIVLGKGIITMGITLLLGYPLRTAILTAIALAQCAEFSFYLATIGLQLGAIGPEAYSLMLTAATASIILSPYLHALGESAVAWAERHSTSVGPGQREVTDAVPESLAGHAVLCGYGRVGRLIAVALRKCHIPLLVIDLEAETAVRLRARGASTLRGDATSPALLERANLQHALVLVIAIPDPLAVRQIVVSARQMNPQIPIVVRTHSVAERRKLCQLGAERAVLAELELALELSRRTLHHCGVPAADRDETLLALRQRLDALPSASNA